MSKMIFFDDDLGGSDVIGELDKVPSGQIYYKKHSIDGVRWYFFSTRPITIDIIKKALRIDQPNCKHDWTDANDKCEDCGHQG